MTAAQPLTWPPMIPMPPLLTAQISLAVPHLSSWSPLSLRIALLPTEAVPSNLQAQVTSVTLSLLHRSSLLWFGSHGSSQTSGPTACSQADSFATVFAEVHFAKSSPCFTQSRRSREDWRCTLNLLWNCTWKFLFSRLDKNTHELDQGVTLGCNFFTWFPLLSKIN